MARTLCTARGKAIKVLILINPSSMCQCMMLIHDDERKFGTGKFLAMFVMQVWLNFDQPIDFFISLMGTSPLFTAWFLKCKLHNNANASLLRACKSKTMEFKGKISKKLNGTNYKISY